MAISSSSSIFTLTFILFFTLITSQSSLNSAEQEAVYHVLDSINSDYPWRSLFPDDLCYTAPHGVVCDIFTGENSTDDVLHVTELSFGYVSDYSPNPTCTSFSTINPHIFSSFSHLRKLFFYKCFTQTTVSLPDLSTLKSPLEELVFVDNPALVGSLNANINKLKSLRRLVLTGSNVSGEIPNELGDLINIEQITLSRNTFTGEIPSSLSKLKNLKVLDLSQNAFEGSIPKSIGALTDLLKLDLSWNKFSGKFPESMNDMKELEFIDISYNKFTNSGVPLFIAEMKYLKEVYMNGNLLGGEIPEIWENLGGIIGIGLSGTGLVGNIPATMGIYLKNLCYLGLDNNYLEGKVPEELGALEYVSELNLEKNNLSGRLPFSAKFVSKVGEKLKLQGNQHLCIDQGLLFAKSSATLRQVKVCNKPDNPQSVLFFDGGSSNFRVSYVLVFICFCLGML